MQDLRELHFFERGWLSSNNIVFVPVDGGGGTVVDTGYDSHSVQTVQLVEGALNGAPLATILNTHLHSDHCGGNAALQRRWPSATTLVPEECFAAARDWCRERLTFDQTGQRCQQFKVNGWISAGQEISLCGRTWEVHGAPGHDPTAVMLFQAETRTLISGDALWERRLAIIFPELVGEAGFDRCLSTLKAIERLSPRVVIPGHGPAFADIAGALKASRQRIEAFKCNPDRHTRHALRALVMFHLLEVRRSSMAALVSWVRNSPLFAVAIESETSARALIEGLIAEGIVQKVGDEIVVN